LKPLFARAGGWAGQLTVAGMACDDVGPKDGDCAAALGPVRTQAPINGTRIDVSHNACRIECMKRSSQAIR